MIPRCGETFHEGLGGACRRGRVVGWGARFVTFHAYDRAMPKSTGETWMGAPAVASYLGVTLRTVYAIIDEGQLPAFKIRRVIRIRREDVDEYLERCRIKPGELRHLYPATSEEDV